jgi:hypothetical protein
MTYKPITVDRNALTIMDVQFPDIETLESIAQGIGTNMFEGFEPTKETVEIIRDCCLGKITITEAINFAIKNNYEK